MQAPPNGKATESSSLKHKREENTGPPSFFFLQRNESLQTSKRCYPEETDGKKQRKKKGGFFHRLLGKGKEARTSEMQAKGGFNPPQGGEKGKKGCRRRDAMYVLYFQLCNYC